MWKPTHGKPLVCVHWLDAHGSATQAYTEQNIPHATYPMETYGILLRDDEQGVSVASETYYDDIDHERNYRGHTFIPRSMVERVEIVRAPARKRAKRATRTASQRTVSGAAAHPAGSDQ